MSMELLTHELTTAQYTQSRGVVLSHAPLHSQYLFSWHGGQTDGAICPYQIEYEMRTVLSASLQCVQIAICEMQHKIIVGPFDNRFIAVRGVLHLRLPLQLALGL